MEICFFLYNVLYFVVIFVFVVFCWVDNDDLILRFKVYLRIDILYLNVDYFVVIVFFFL